MSTYYYVSHPGGSPGQKEVFMDFQDNNTSFQSPEASPAANSAARASRILGFLAVGSGIASALIPVFAPFPLMFSMLGIVFAFVARNQTGKLQGHAITGMVCSSVTLAFLLVVAVFLISFFNTAGGQQIVAEYLRQYNEMLEAYNEFYGY